MTSARRAAWAKKYYQKNKALYRARNKKWQAKNPAAVREHKARYRAERRALVNTHKAKPCTDCGIQYEPHIMQFDHVRGRKKFNISGCIDYSPEVLLREIAKCDVVCANCHMDRTWKRRRK